MASDSQLSIDSRPYPLISIITVVLNARDTIENTIRSVATQRYRHLEYIVVDGGSTDGTLDVIWRHQHDIAKWISEPDSGIYDAMNKGVQLASGDWLLFLGADDVLVDCLHDVAGHLADDHTIYYGDVYWRGFHELYGHDLTSYRILTRNICHQGIFYPRAVFRAHSFDLRYRLCADHYLNILCYSDSRFHFVRLPLLIAIYGNEGASTGSDDKQFRSDLPEIARAHFSGWTYIRIRLRFLAVSLLQSLGLKGRLKALMHRVH